LLLWLIRLVTLVENINHQEMITLFFFQFQTRLHNWYLLFIPTIRA